MKRDNLLPHTWYVVSNLSYMNRVIMLVFPADWSPRKTSLYLASGVIDWDILLYYIWLYCNIYMCIIPLIRSNVTSQMWWKGELVCCLTEEFTLHELLLRRWSVLMIIISIDTASLQAWYNTHMYIVVYILAANLLTSNKILARYGRPFPWEKEMSHISNFLGSTD